MVKFYTVRILAAFLFLGSFKFGFLAYAEYGRWIGWVTFIISVVSAVILFKVADKLRRTKS
jgi:phosphoglycerol transferase MdoB-like AlkP superfamily enzyme